MADEGRNPDVKRRQDDLPHHVPETDVTIIKMHGDAESPVDTVLIRDDYQDYALNRPLFIDMLTADLITKTFLFLGVSFEDPNLTFILGRLKSIFRGARKHHYWITRRPKSEAAAERFDMRVSDLRRYGIVAVTVKDYDSELPEILNQVNIRARQLKRMRAVFIAGSLADRNGKAEPFQNLVSMLAKQLVRNGLSVVTGLGRGLGDHTTTAALEEMRRLGNRANPDQLIVRPFPAGANEGDPRRTVHRREMLQHSRFAVFIRGRGEENRAHGMWEEYLLLRELGGWPIPLGATGNHAAGIWSEVWRDFDTIFGGCRHAKEVKTLFPMLNDPSLSHLELVAGALKIIELLQI